jgi:CBS domain-containing protein
MEGVITSLVITDESGHPVGVVHIHDILRAKIV